jgi:hypothetical protein
MHWSASEVLFKCVVENDVQGVRTYIESGEDVNAQNEEVPAAVFVYLTSCTLLLHHIWCLQGMTALHFAADRGHSEIADVLLQHGVNVNAIDSTGQTALMYAVSCENKVRHRGPVQSTRIVVLLCFVLRL